MKTFKVELKEDCKGAPDVGGLHRLSAHAKTFKVSEQIEDFIYICAHAQDSKRSANHR